MAFEELEQNTENIRTETQAYIESNLAYYKLKSFKVAMKSMTLILKITLMVLFLLMVLLFCSIAGSKCATDFDDINRVRKNLPALPFAYLVTKNCGLYISC